MRFFFIFIITFLFFLSCSKSNKASLGLTKEVSFYIVDSLKGTPINEMNIAICHNKCEFPLYVIFKDYNIKYGIDGSVKFNPNSISIKNIKENEKIEYFLYFKKKGYKYYKIKLTDSINQRKILVSSK